MPSRGPLGGGSGVAVAATSLIETFALGMVAYLFALLIAVLAMAIVLIIAAYLNRRTDLSST